MGADFRIGLRLMNKVRAECAVCKHETRRQAASRADSHNAPEDERSAAPEQTLGEIDIVTLWRARPHWLFTGLSMS